jgi:hypothetical protein
MNKRALAKKTDVNLVDVLDRLLEKGVVARGEVAIRLADIDLIYLDLQLLVTSISKIASLQGTKRSQPERGTLSPKDKEYLQALEEEIKRTEKAIPSVIDGKDERDIEKGLSRLVLTLVELIRRLLEREAFRQVKLHHLSQAETQKLGLALKALAKKMELMKATFGLDDKELNIDLGPLGSVLDS